MANLDRIKKLLGKASEAGKELVTPPAEPDMEDPNLLPNQQMSGQGLSNLISAYGKLAPDTEDYPEVSSDVKTGDPAFDEKVAKFGNVKIDPLAIGSLTKLSALSKIPTTGKSIQQLKAMASLPEHQSQTAQALIQQAINRRMALGQK